MMMHSSKPTETDAAHTCGDPLGQLNVDRCQSAVTTLHSLGLAADAVVDALMFQPFCWRAKNGYYQLNSGDTYHFTTA